MYIWWIRLLRGYVKFQMRGSGMEDAINMAVENGVELWNISRSGKHIEGYVRAKEYRYFVLLVKKCGARSRVLKKRGTPFIIHRYRFRPGLLVGAVLFFTLLLVSQNFIWEIRFTDYDGKYKDYLVQKLEEQGVSTGSYVGDLDFRVLQQEMLMELEEMAWLALNINGSVLNVEVSEKTVPPDMQETVPANVVAKKSGKIVRTEIFKGTEVVKADDVVYKGDLLISGVTVNEVGDVNYFHGSGRIYAETIDRQTVSFQLNQSEPYLTGETVTRKYFSILGVKIPLFIAFSLPGEYEKQETFTPLTLGDTEFMVGMTEEQYRFYEYQEMEYTEQQAREIIEAAFQEYEETELADIEIVSHEDFEEMEDDVLTITREYTCVEDIAKTIPYYTDAELTEEE